MDALTALGISLALLAYLHAGYPMLVWFLGRLRSRGIVTGPDTQGVVFVVAAHNEADVIAEKVENTLRLDYPPERLQVVVVCDGSSDGTAVAAARAGGPRVTVLHAFERLGKGAALNRGVEAGNGDIIVMSDANCFWRPDALRRLVAPFHDPEVGLASGRKMVREEAHQVAEGEQAYWSFESFLRQAETATGSTVGVVGEILAIRRALWVPVPLRGIPDDHYLCLRVLKAGYRSVFVPDAVCVEWSSATTAHEMVRRRRLSAGRFALLGSPGNWPWRRPFIMFQLCSHKVLRLAAPWLILAAASTALALVATGRAVPLAWLALGAVGGIGAFALLALSGRNRNLGPLRRPATVCLYLVSGYVATASGLFMYLRGRSLPGWERVPRRPGRPTTDV